MWQSRAKPSNFLTKLITLDINHFWCGKQRLKQVLKCSVFGILRENPRQGLIYICMEICTKRQKRKYTACLWTVPVLIGSWEEDVMPLKISDHWTRLLKEYLYSYQNSIAVIGYNDNESKDAVFLIHNPSPFTNRNFKWIMIKRKFNQLNNTEATSDSVSKSNLIYKRIKSSQWLHLPWTWLDPALCTVQK